VLSDKLDGFAADPYFWQMTTYFPFIFKTSPETIQLAVMYYVRYTLSFRQVADILHGHSVDIWHETVRF